MGKRKAIIYVILLAFLSSLLPLGVWGNVASAGGNRDQQTASWSDEFNDLTGLSTKDNVQIRNGQVTLDNTGEWIQNDWSGGPGQKNWNDNTRYWKQNDSEQEQNLFSKTLITNPDGDIQLRQPVRADDWTEVVGETTENSIGNSPAVTSLGNKAYVMAGTHLNEVLKIDGTDSNNIWVLGETKGYFLLKQWNGTDWEDHPVLGIMNQIEEESGAGLPIEDVASITVSFACVSPTETVLAIQSDENTFILRFDGSMWSLHSIIESNIRDLQCMVTSGTDNIWLFSRWSDSFYRYDGTAWQAISKGIIDWEDAVNAWVYSPNDVYIVSNAGKYYKYNGNTWSLLAQNGNVNSVVIDQDNILTVGSSSVLKYNSGTGNWDILYTSPLERLTSITTYGSDIWAFGFLNTGRATYPYDFGWVRFSGGLWSSGSTGVLGGDASLSKAVSSNDIWFVEGASGLMGTERIGSIFSFNGSACEIKYNNRSEENGCYDYQTGEWTNLADVPMDSKFAGFSNGNDGADKIFLIGPGTDFKSDPNWLTNIAHDKVYAFNPSTNTWEFKCLSPWLTKGIRTNWFGADVGYWANGNIATVNNKLYQFGGGNTIYTDANGVLHTPEDFDEIAATAADDAWAISYDRLSYWIYHWDGNLWTKQYEYTDKMPSGLIDTDNGGIDAVSSNNVYSQHGDQLLHYDGNSWQVLYDFNIPDIQYCSIDVLDNEHIYVLMNFSLYRYNATTGVANLVNNFTASLGESEKKSLEAVNENNIYVTTQGTTYHWDGISWQSLPNQLQMYTIQMANANRGFGLGSSDGGNNQGLFEWNGTDWNHISGFENGIDLSYSKENSTFYLNLRLNGQEYGIQKNSGSGWSELNNTSVFSAEPKRITALNDNAIFASQELAIIYWNGEYWTSQKNYCSEFKVYDPATNTWEESVRKPCPSAVPYGGLLCNPMVGNDGKIYIFNSLISGLGQITTGTNEVFNVYDPATDTWDRTEQFDGTLKDPEIDFGNFFLFNSRPLMSDDHSKIYYLNESGAGTSSVLKENPRKFLIYDLATKDWSIKQVKQGPYALYSNGSRDADGNSYLFGGLDWKNTGNILDAAWKLSDKDLFYTPGVVDSSILDLQSNSRVIGEFSASVHQPNGTDIAFYMRSGTNPNPDTNPETWTTWTEVQNGEQTPNTLDGKRYIQYRLVLSNNLNLNDSPRVEEVKIRYGQSPGIIKSIPIAPGKPTGWKQVTFETSTPGQSNIRVRILDANGNPLPEWIVPGNNQGFNQSPIDISGINAEDYRLLRLGATLETPGDGTPYLNKWEISWNFQANALLTVDSNGDGKYEDNGKPVNAGDVLDYNIYFTNDSANMFTGLRAKGIVPGGTTYIPGSTRVNGTPVPDSNGCPVTGNGLPLTNMDCKKWVQTDWSNSTKQNLEMVNNKLQLANNSSLLEFEDKSWVDNESYGVEMEERGLKLSSNPIFSNLIAHSREGNYTLNGTMFASGYGTAVSTGKHLYLLGNMVGIIETQAFQTSDNRRYDIDTDKWELDTNSYGTLSPIPEDPAKQTLFRQSAVNGNNIILTGGIIPGNQSPTELPKEVYVYNTLNNTWQQKPDAPFGCYSGSGSTASTVNGRTYFFPGFHSTENGNIKPTDGTIFSCDQNGENWEVSTNQGGTLSPLPYTPAGYQSHSAVIGNKIYLTRYAGNPATGQVAGMTQVYDPANNTWSNVADYLSFTEKETLHNHQIDLATKDGRLYIVIYDLVNGEVTYDTIKTYDPTTNQWYRLGSIKDTRGRVKNFIHIDTVDNNLFLCDSEQDYTGEGFQLYMRYRFYILTGDMDILYNPEGGVLSAVRDRGNPPPAGVISWSAIEPTDTGVEVWVRGSNDYTPANPQWSPWVKATNEVALPAEVANRRFFQYKAILSTTNRSVRDGNTPILSAVSVGSGDAFLQHPGWVESDILDAGKQVWFDSMSWQASVPDGTTLNVFGRTSNNQVDWTQWTQLGNNQPIPDSLQDKQFFQYRVEMDTTKINGVNRQTPALIRTEVRYPTSMTINYKVKVNASGAGKLAADTSYLVNYASVVTNETGEVETNKVSNTVSVEPPPPPPPSLSDKWYLAEGYTGNDNYPGELFDTWISVLNPQTTAVPITATFMKNSGSPVVRSYTIEPHSRLTINADIIPGLENTDVATKIVATNGKGIAVERAMYFRYMGYEGGHSSIATENPEKTWYFAEGCTTNESTMNPEPGTFSDFDTYLTIMNPDKEVAHITATYMNEEGGTLEKNYSINPNTRHTIKVDDIPEFSSSYHVSTTIKSDVGVVAERPMYFNYKGRTGGSDTIGVTTPAVTWYLAEGYTAEIPRQFDTWNLLANPTNQTCEVTGTFMNNSGQTYQVNYSLKPHSRLTVKVDDVPGFGSTDVSSKFVSTNDVPFLAERSMYFDYDGLTDGTASIGTSAPHDIWYVPEGYQSDTFDTWILIQNPNNKEAHANIRFITENGDTITRTVTVPPNARCTIGTPGITELLNKPFSTQVDADVPTVVEGVTYFNYQGIGGGGESIGIGVDR